MIKEKIFEKWYPGQIAIEEVEFYQIENATRFARFLNRHLPGQAARTGNIVRVGYLPKAVADYVYSRIGALPCREVLR